MSSYSVATQGTAMSLFRTLLLSALLFCFSTFSFTQQCDAPIVSTSKAPVMMTEQFESNAGEIMAQQTLTSARALEVVELAAPLEQIVRKLESAAPPSSIKFHVRLVEAPYANAYTFPGGYIFITRKALLIAKNEDEVAGVLAHEMGHVLTRQVARDYEQVLRQVLGVKTFATSQDAEERFHELIENFAAHPGRTVDAFTKIANREKKEQIEADQISLYLLSRAGYEPSAFIDYFDRLTGNKGKIGSGWSEFFRTTRPESKRVREMLKTNAIMPEQCKIKAPHMSADEFSRWRAALIAYSAFGKQDNVPSGHKHELKEPLRSGITYLRFSPDGKYILAQDPASIYVLSRDPLTTLFRFDAEDANDAQFTPDSQNIVFVTEASRVEKWNIAQRTQVDADELHFPSPCIQQALSPTGRYLACLQANEKNEFPRQLAVIDVETGEPVWIQKDVIREEVTYFGYGFSFNYYRRIWLDFSPDGRYLVGSGDGNPFVYDFETKQPLQLNSDLKTLLKHSHFLANDRIFSYTGKNLERATIAAFPSGKILQPEIGLGALVGARSSNPGVLIVRPYLHSAAALIEIATKKVLLTSSSRAVDMYENLLVAERSNGEIGLYDGPSKPPIATATLTKGPVTRFQSVAISRDGGYVAYSDVKRGALWRLEDDTRVGLFRGFRGSFISQDQQLFALFPSEDSYNGQQGVTKAEAKYIGTDAWRLEEMKKPGLSIGRIDIKTLEGKDVQVITRQFSASQHGSVIAMRKRVDDRGKNTESSDYDFLDVTSGKKLWSRSFEREQEPAWFYNPIGETLVFATYADSPAGAAILNKDKSLSRSVDKMGDRRKGAWLLEVLNERTGAQQFTLLVDTGLNSFRIGDVDAVADTVVIADENHRLLLYNSAGKRIGRIFGSRATLDPSGKLMAVETEPGRLALYSVADIRKQQTYTFAAKVVHAAFTSDASKLVVITSDQTVWSVDLPKIMAVGK
jgi:WD40 repeat protein/predicted SprT family Zn-dependent metalloprotease